MKLCQHCFCISSRVQKERFKPCLHWDDIVLLCHHAAFRTKNSIAIYISWCQVEAVIPAFHSCGSLTGSRLQNFTIEYLRLYVFGHFHHAWHFAWYALEMQYLHLKTEARLLTDAFLASIKLLSETQFCLSNLMSRQFYVLASLKMWVG